MTTPACNGASAMRYRRHRKASIRLWDFLRKWRWLVLVLPFLGLFALRPQEPSLRRGSDPLPLHPKLPLSASVLNELNKQLVDADKILQWTVENIPDSRLIQVTSFGPSGLVILHKLHRSGYLAEVPTVTIDTLHLFPETYEFISQVKAQYSDMNLRVYKPGDFEDRDDFDEEHGEDLWKTNYDMFSYLTKVEPMVRALDELQASAWITGRRSSQGGEREQLQAFEVDNLNPERLKINPLAHWSYDDVWDYIRMHKIPYNPLHDKGYKSVGDEMTTVSVGSETEERAGRFVGLNRTECGMHAHLEKVKAMRDEVEKQKGVFRPPTLHCSDCLDVDSENFDELVLKGENEMLLEFYSPFCGACRAFSPEYKKVAKKAKLFGGLQVARFDITEHEIPDAMIDAGFDVDGTPSVYFVQRNPFRAALFEGMYDAASLLKWLASNNVSYAPWQD